jgi:hypothetical protein
MTLGHVYFEFAEFALEGLLALAVAGVACRIGDRLVLAVTQVFGQFGIQGLLDQQLGQLLQQVVLAN